MQDMNGKPLKRRKSQKGRERKGYFSQVSGNGLVKKWPPVLSTSLHINYVFFIGLAWEKVWRSLAISTSLVNSCRRQQYFLWMSHQQRYENKVGDEKRQWRKVPSRTSSGNSHSNRVCVTVVWRKRVAILRKDDGDLEEDWRMGLQRQALSNQQKSAKSRNKLEFPDERRICFFFWLVQCLHRHTRLSVDLERLEKRLSNSWQPMS